MPDTFLRIARILRSHGLKGELKVMPDNDFLIDAEPGTACWVETKFGHREKMFIEKLRSGNDTILKLREISDKSTADKFAQGQILMEESKLGELPDQTYYVKDLIGLSVWDQFGKQIGSLSDVISTSAHDLYEVTLDGKKKLVPAVPEFIKEVDLKNRILRIHSIPGLIDDAG